MTEHEIHDDNIIDKTKDAIDIAGSVNTALFGKSVIKTSTPVRKSRNRKNIRRGRPMRNNKRIIKDREKQVSQLFLPFLNEVKGLIPFIVDISEFEKSLNSIYERWIPYFGREAVKLANKWAYDSNERSKMEVERMLARAFGVETTTIFEEYAVAQAIDAIQKEASSFITSVPIEYLNSINEAVRRDLRQEPQPDGRSLTEQIQFLTGHTEKRARLIARDQSSKIWTGITQVRQQNLGIEEYIWRNVRDERVVGNPNGLYPRGNRVHGDHWKRAGKKFRWDTPPEDGHPGFSINCRCFAEPIIDYNNLTLA